jgi:solute carrier family 25 protein 44
LSLYGLYGSTASFALEVALFPMSVVKTRQQVERGKPTPPMKMIADLARKEGVPGLYRGFVSGTLGVLPAEMIYYAAYEVTKEVMTSGGYGHLSPMVSGLVAEMTSAAWVVPFDVVSQRLMIQDVFSPPVRQGRGTARLFTSPEVSQRLLVQQVLAPPRSARDARGHAIQHPAHSHHHHYSGMMDAFRHIYTLDGARGLFRGYGVMLLSSAPSSMLWWQMYESLKTALNKIDLRNKLFGLRSHEGRVIVGKEGTVTEDPIVHFIASACSSMVTIPISAPLDVAKTRLQTQNFLHSRGEASRRKMYSNVFDVIYTMVKEEGAMSLFRGIGPRFAFALPSTVFTMVIYEQIKIHSQKTEVK